MPKPFELGGECSLMDLYEVAAGGRKTTLPRAAAEKMGATRKAMMDYVAKAGAVYGVNTGFGELAARRIPGERCRQLQLNLIRSHACGAGEPMRDDEIRGLMFLRANELARGRSGTRPDAARQLAEFLNRGIIPYVPSRGSVGASGDLAPSAHIALALIGEGTAKTGPNGKWADTAGILSKAGISPLRLEEKEGLALINGTQAMQSVGGIALLESLNVWHAATGAAALSAEALKATPAPFDEDVVALKPYPGQSETAAILRALMDGSEIRKSHLTGDPRVQDPYSIRCIPQVHGAALDALVHACSITETEMKSATDNPVLIWKDEKDFSDLRLASGGNFHGEPLSLAFDYACCAMTALGNICERRIFQLVSDPNRILPPFLAKDSGVESGWMITQYTAASLASENKTLAHPASADSIPTSGSKEDFVSMGMWAAIKLGKVTENAARIAAIELLAAAQALEFHKPLKPGKGAQELYAAIRETAPALECDAPLGDAIETLANVILDGEVAGN
ncbi:MAG: histidine ammonia-lyase [Elusimicrobiales bacterium]